MQMLGTTAVLTHDDYEELSFDWGRLTWFASGPLGSSQTMTVGRCEIAPGCENPVHRHPNCEEVLHVLAGEIEHSIEGEASQRMSPGMTISIGTGVRHNARNVGDETAVLMICFSSADRETIGED